MRDVPAQIVDILLLCAMLWKRKQDATKTLLPFSLSGKPSMCTLMLLTNLAKVEWIFVPCKAQLLRRTVCTRPKWLQNHNETKLNAHQDCLCHPDQILQDKKCFLFLWRSKSNETRFYPMCGNNPTAVEAEKLYQFISQAISVPFHPIMLQTSNSQTMNVLTYPKLLNNRMSKNKNMCNIFLCVMVSMIATRTGVMKPCKNAKTPQIIKQSL